MNKKELQEKSMEMITRYVIKGIKEDIEEDIKQTYTLKANNSKEIINPQEIIEKSKAISYGVIKKYISYVNIEKLQQKEIKLIESTTEKQVKRIEKSIERITNNNNFNIKLYNCLLYANYKEKYQATTEIDNDILYNEDMEIVNTEEIKERYKDLQLIYKKSRIVTPTKKSYKVTINTSAIENFEEYTNIIILSIYENINNVFVNKKGEIIFTRNTFKEICKPLKKEINFFYRDNKRKIEIDNTENTYILDNYSFLDYKKLFTENKYKIDITKMLKDLKFTNKQLEIISYKIQGLSFSQIASIYNVVPNTIKKILYRKQEKMKEYLQVNYNIAI